MGSGDTFWIVAAGVAVSLGAYIHATITSSDENNQPNLGAIGGKASSRKKRRGKASNKKTRHR